jgi:macrolide-specific efflux system membrane fusion protein
MEMGAFAIQFGKFSKVGEDVGGIKFRGDVGMKVWMSLVGSIVALAFGLGFWLLGQGKVQVAEVKQGSLKEAVYGIGTVDSDQKFVWKSPLTHTLSNIHVVEGQLVRIEQMLFQVMDGPVIRAPFAGTVTRLPYNRGENIFQNTVVIEIQNLAKRHIKATLEQQGALRVKKGAVTVVSFENLRGQKFSGAVESLYPQGDQFVARISTHDLPEAIIPGMTADVAIEVAEKVNVLIVPARAVVNGFVTKISGRHRTKVPVIVGIMDHDTVEISSARLAAGDKLLLPR